MSVLTVVVLQLRRMVIGASHQLPVVAQTYYERAPARAAQAIADCFGRLGERGRAVAGTGTLLPRGGRLRRVMTRIEVFQSMS